MTVFTSCGNAWSCHNAVELSDSGWGPVAPGWEFIQTGGPAGPGDWYCPCCVLELWTPRVRPRFEVCPVTGLSIPECNCRACCLILVAEHGGRR